MSSAIRRRGTCRLCNSSDVELVLPLAPSAIADAYLPADRAGEVQDAYALDVFRCAACGHVQLLDVLDPEVLFRDYIYTSASSPGLIDHFRAYARELESRGVLAHGGLALDIGSNDGTLLRFLEEAGMEVLGVDPATRIAQRATASGIPTIAAFFSSDVARRMRRDHGPAALVTANNVFAHSDGIADMTDGIRELLAADGIFVFEVSYLLDLLRNSVFDYVYHEHLDYHSVLPLRVFFERHGLELIDVERIGTKGGSIRGFVQPTGGPRTVAARVDDLVREERDAGLDDASTFHDFARRIDARKAEVRAELEGIRADGGEIAGYGASATVTTLLHHFGLDEFIGFIVDDNEDRQGRLSPGHHIPVLPPLALYERAPACVVVLAWRFAEPIIGTHAEYVDAGGQFLVPLPDVRLVRRGSYRFR